MMTAITTLLTDESVDISRYGITVETLRLLK